MRQNLFFNTKISEFQEYFGGLENYDLSVTKVQLASLIDDCINARSLDDVHAICSKVMVNYGYDYFVYGVRGVRPGLEPLFQVIYESGTEWVEHYRKRNYFNVDPLINYCEKSIVPHVWHADDEDAGLDKMEQDLLKEARDFGMHQIVSIPTHGTQNDMCIFRLSRAKLGGSTKRVEISDLSDLHYVCHFLHDSVTRILLADPREAIAEIHLTPRELEVLYRASQGHSSARISQLLNISENTVLTHMKRIHLKLGVRSRQHAVSKAMTMGLLKV